MRRARKPRARQNEALEVNGLGAPVEVRRHPAARRMTLRVSRTQRTVIMTLPMTCDLKQAGEFLVNHLDWVRERLTKLPDAQPFTDGALVPLRGVPRRIVFAGAARGRGVVSEYDDIDSGEAQLQIHGQPEHAPRRLQDWLIAQARADLTVSVDHHAKFLGLRPKRITVRDQISRWGSCSSTGNLSFSWRLVMAPPRILDYVAAHEVAHLQEMNHGPRFWALVRETCPEMDEAKAWLDVYGVELHRYGASA
jgi:predicted metal-dependent hydrolase